MGITKADSTLLFYSKSIGVDFSQTCMLGRLNLYTTKDQIREIISRYPVQVKNPEEVVFKDEYSEPLFEMLGAREVDSLDFSDYEKATIIHDMNNPVPVNLHNRFTCVVDSGTLEHIFNFPVAIRNCMEMIKPGGYFIGITPVNNQMGHGFYQFSPELYYRVFSEENGFKVIRMFVSLEVEDQIQWYEVADPKDVRDRIMLVNNWPVFIRFIAQKIEQKPLFTRNPQQSDYTTTWNAFTSLKTNTPSEGGNRLSLMYKKLLPYRLKVILRNLYNLTKVEKVDSPHLGKINPDHYKKVDI